MRTLLSELYLAVLYAVAGASVGLIMATARTLYMLNYKSEDLWIGLITTVMIVGLVLGLIINYERESRK